jgi:hypothetical protein
MDAFPHEPRIQFLGRYIGYPTNRKCISHYPGMYQHHLSAGRPSFLFHQIGYSDMEGGYDRGRQHALTAKADAESPRVGWQGESHIVACMDRFYAKQGYRTLTAQDLREYMRGFRSVLGDRAGFYGFYDSMRDAINGGWANFYVQCGARSAHVPGIHCWQENNKQPTIIDAATDILELYCSWEYAFGGDGMGNWDTPIKLTAEERRANGDPDYAGDDATFTPDVWTKYASFYAGQAMERGDVIIGMLKESAAREAATLKLVEAVTADKGITVDSLRQMINEAVRENVRITGDIKITGAGVPTLPNGGEHP